MPAESRTQESGVRALFFSLLRAIPRLGTAGNGQADIPPHDKPGAVVFEVKAAAVDGTGVRIENLTAGETGSVLPQALQNNQADDGLVAPRTRALVTDITGFRGIEAGLDTTVEGAVLLINADQTPRLAGLVVNGLPQTHG